MKILITGVAGLIGSKFADWVIDKFPNYEVHGIDDLSGGYLENVNLKVIFHKVDLQEFEVVNKFFEHECSKKNFDLIYHFAAYAAEGLSPFIRKYNYSNNLLATTNLVNLSIKYNVKRFIFTSSMATYGFGENKLPFDEETPQIPVDPYGVAKLACEMDIKIAGDQHGLEWCILRPHNVYGDNQNIWDKYRNVLGIWMYQLLNKEDITIYGDGKQKRAFSYTNDILEPLWKAGVDPRAKNQCINLGGTIDYTINEAADMLLDIVGYGKKTYCEQRHEVKYAYSTHTKSEKLLDFKMKVELREGLTKMWEWAKFQQKRERKAWDNYELDIGIYDYWK
jgi:UDP-glucose 4-epimerase